jgi:squalene synthase HpnC
VGAIADVATLPRAAAVLDQADAENFPVASRLLSRRDREHLIALYGYARLVDDTGDEAAGDRTALLDELEGELDRIYAGEAPRHPLTRRLRATVEACDLPRAPLQALIAANRQDQVVQAYATFGDLLRYCELSANPVGRLVLHIFDAATPDRIERSDRVCTALQLAEHWQDVAEDLARGRVYLPTEDLERFSVNTADLGLSPAPERVRLLLAFEVARGREILAEGAPLVGTLRGRHRVAVAAFVAGGRAAFAAIERAGCDVSAGPPRATDAARGRELLRVLTGRIAR